MCVHDALFHIHICLYTDLFISVFINLSLLQSYKLPAKTQSQKVFSFKDILLLKLFKFYF